MILKKIRTYGCSFVAGDGVTATENFSYLLGQKLNLPVINRGENGASNKKSIIKLMNDVCTSDDYQHDLFVFSWTGLQRTTFYNENYNEWINILLGYDHDDQEIKTIKQFYYKYIYTDYEALHTLYTQQLMVQSFFKDKKLRYVFLNAIKEDGIMYDDSTLAGLRAHIDMSHFAMPYDQSIHNHLVIGMKFVCNDGFHPNVEGHEFIAKRIYDMAIHENHWDYT